MTFEQAFNAVKKKLANKNAKNVENFAIQITITDEGFGGTLYAQVKDGVLYVEPYDYKDNNAILNISKTALSNYLARRKSLSKVISEGAVVYGDSSAIETLRNLPEVESQKANKAVKTEKTVDIPKKRGRKPTIKAEKVVSKVEEKTAEKAEINPVTPTAETTQQEPKTETITTPETIPNFV